MVDILAIGVHPDDVELACSGTLLKQMSLGNTVAILDLTLGEMGTRGNAQIRTQEAMRAAQILGVFERIQLDLKDGFIHHEESTIKEIIKAIRYFKPKIVLANSERDRHPDHGRAAKITADACYYAGLLKIDTNYKNQNQAPHRPDAVYHYIQDYQYKADVIVDVSDHVDQKFKSILAYQSQFFGANTSEPETPISGKPFLEHIRSSMRIFGRLINAEYGEGFTVNRTIGVDDLLHLR